MTAATARAYWTIDRERGEIRGEALPGLAPGQALVRALHSGVSRGTELLVHRGMVPPSEHARMRAPHQAGAFPWPVKYGYSSVGIVEQGPPELIGRQVFCLYPHQTAYVVDAAQLHPLPEGLPPARAVLAANMETALNAVWDAQLKAGDRVAVVGAGVVGLLVGYLASRHPGTEVELVDTDARKADAARALGLTLCAPVQARAGADLVVHASATPAGLRTALSLAGMEATVIELSWYGDQSVALELGGAFHSQRLSLRASQVGQLPAAQRPRWDYARRLRLALRLLLDSRLDRLVRESAPFERLPEVIAALARGEGEGLCQRIDYG